MSFYSRAPLTAVLGPTNTGKTHLAVERMLGHTSGMMGFPLRLLAREVYDRIIALRGPGSAALLTGEERIESDHARYLLCTAEAMPVDGRQRAFVALDEAQLGQDRERGHVFTSRLLHARGRDETMILGSGALNPLVRILCPGIEVISRPRFSTLRHVGPAKLSRLPPRSVIVAFSAEEVYTIAEAMRRFSGGAAVVMGSLSPRTRNAQVAMFQSGEVDYLVATDAIGMGLNLDVAHVAFASLQKFDGQRLRRLTIAEMAQIAGRAGRHQRDGSFGSVGSESAFTDEEVEAIEAHEFPAIDWLYWRNPAPATDSVAALIADLEQPPNEPHLRSAPEATDLAVLRQLAGDAEIVDRASDPALVARLWAAASLPDFTKSGPQGHARLVARLWGDLSRGNGTIDADWFAQRLAALDDGEGPVEALAERIARVRTCCYIAHRRDWLADPVGAAEAAQAVEARLSDALHAALTARFVDRRTTVLLRGLAKGAADLPVSVDETDGAVRVDGEHIGTLDGFAFRVDASARAADHKLMLAAAERHLTAELAARATALAGSADDAFTLATVAGEAPAIIWQGRRVATLTRGKSRLAPQVLLAGSIAALEPRLVGAIRSRLSGWIDAMIGTVLEPLVAAEALARSAESPAPLRALLAALVANGGVIARDEVLGPLKGLPKDKRPVLTRLGIFTGALDLFILRMLRPEPQRWRAALAAAHDSRPVTALVENGVLYVDEADVVPGSPSDTDYRSVGSRRLRVDLVERLNHHVHTLRAAAETAARAAMPAGQRPDRKVPVRFAVSHAYATSIGLKPDERRTLMRELGFRAQDPRLPEDELAWGWFGTRPSGGRRRPPPHERRRRRAAASDNGTTAASGTPSHPAARQRRARRIGQQLAGGSSRSPLPGAAAAPDRPISAERQRERDASPFAVLATLLDPPPPDSPVDT